MKSISHTIKYASQVQVAHACNLNYWKGRDQEGHGLKPVQANSSGDPITKYPTQKQG
jgi:hypothetical protein